MGIYIISYIISWPKAVCASGCYYELKTASGSLTSLAFPQQVKTPSGGYLGHGREGIGRKELWL